MKTNEKHPVIARFTRWSLVPVGLLVAALCFAGPSRAQSNAAPASPAVKPVDAAMGQAQAVPAALQTPSRTATAEPVAPGEKNLASQAKGQHEGITVHGHWTIEVRNPNGSVVKHVEFENASCPTQTVSVTTTFFGSTTTQTLLFPGAALALSLVGSGQGSLGAWEVILGSSAALNTNPNLPPGCVSVNEYALISFPNAITLLQNNVSQNYLLSCNAGNCFATLNPPPAPSLGSPTISLSGQFTPAAGGSIDLVSTGNLMCPVSSVSPAICLTNPVGQVGFGSVAILTGTQLTGSNGVPPPVTYIGGQTVLVTVVISFQ